MKIKKRTTKSICLLLATSIALQSSIVFANTPAKDKKNLLAKTIQLVQKGFNKIKNTIQNKQPQKTDNSKEEQKPSQKLTLFQKLQKIYTNNKKLTIATGLSLISNAGLLLYYLTPQKPSPKPTTFEKIKKSITPQNAFLMGIGATGIFAFLWSFLKKNDRNPDNSDASCPTSNSKNDNDNDNEEERKSKTPIKRKKYNSEKRLTPSSSKHAIKQNEDQDEEKEEGEIKATENLHGEKKNTTKYAPTNDLDPQSRPEENSLLKIEKKENKYTHTRNKLDTIPYKIKNKNRNRKKDGASRFDNAIRNMQLAKKRKKADQKKEELDKKVAEADQTDRFGDAFNQYCSQHPQISTVNKAEQSTQTQEDDKKKKIKNLKQELEQQKLLLEQKQLKQKQLQQLKQTQIDKIISTKRELEQQKLLKERERLEIEQKLEPILMQQPTQQEKQKRRLEELQKAKQKQAQSQENVDNDSNLERSSYNKKPEENDRKRRPREKKIRIVTSNVKNKNKRRAQQKEKHMQAKHQENIDNENDNESFNERYFGQNKRTNRNKKRLSRTSNRTKRHLPQRRKKRNKRKRRNGFINTTKEDIDEYIPQSKPFTTTHQGPKQKPADEYDFCDEDFSKRQPNKFPNSLDGESSQEDIHEAYEREVEKIISFENDDILVGDIWMNDIVTDYNSDNSSDTESDNSSESDIEFRNTSEFIKKNRLKSDEDIDLERKHLLADIELFQKNKLKKTPTKRISSPIEQFNKENEFARLLKQIDSEQYGESELPSELPKEILTKSRHPKRVLNIEKPDEMIRSQQGALSPEEIESIINKYQNKKSDLNEQIEQARKAKKEALQAKIRNGLSHIRQKRQEIQRYNQEIENHIQRKKQKNDIPSQRQLTDVEMENMMQDYDLARENFAEKWHLENKEETKKNEKNEILEAIKTGQYQLNHVPDQEKKRPKSLFLQQAQATGPMGMMQKQKKDFQDRLTSTQLQESMADSTWQEGDQSVWVEGAVDAPATASISMLSTEEEEEEEEPPIPSLNSEDKRRIAKCFFRGAYKNKNRLPGKKIEEMTRKQFPEHKDLNLKDMTRRLLED